VEAFSTLDIDIYVSIFALVFFLFLSFIFSSAEAAIIAVGKVKVRSLVESRVQGAGTLSRLLENPRRVLTAVLIGNTAANTAASALATTVSLSVLNHLGVTNLGFSLAVITTVMAILVLIFGEITPKSLVLRSPEKWALFYAAPLTFLLILLAPLISLVQFFTVAVSRFFGVSSSSTTDLVLTTGELKAMVRIGQEEGLLEKEEQDMIHSIIEFSDTVVREIITPRTDSVCIDTNSSISDAISLIRQKGHSRIPVYEEKIDNIVGILYAKDLLHVRPESLSESLHGYYRKANFIPESRSIESVFRQMKRHQFHMAIVVDEHGGFAGLVTLEDIIEEVMGEIQDEYDSQENPEITPLGDHRYLVDAKMSIYDFSEELGISMTETDDYDTVGGFVLDLFDHMPDSGEVAHYGNLEIIVRQVKKHRILRIEVIKREDNNEGFDD
jgi:putative hemolysin